jgi:molybdopterin converting factor subunit 1
MKTKVLLFAHLRELAGTDQISLELEQGSKGEDLLNSLQARYPEIKDHRHYLKLSMNGEYITTDTELVDQAEIAVFPPVSGG